MLGTVALSVTVYEKALPCGLPLPPLSALTSTADSSVCVSDRRRQRDSRRAVRNVHGSGQPALESDVRRSRGRRDDGPSEQVKQSPVTDAIDGEIRRHFALY